MSAPTGTVWLTLREAAEHCRCSVVTIGRAARLGTLRGYKLARRRSWRFRAEDLDAWLMASTEPVAFVPRRSRERAS
jgi:excisionase family DNA binding protein